MDPIVFELLGSFLVGGMIWLTVFHRPKNRSPLTMPMLTVEKPRPVSSNHRRRTSPSKRVQNRITPPSSPRQKKRTRTKTAETTIQPPPPSTLEAKAATILETCPSCGLQAPDKLLAEHFLGSPSHRNGPEKIIAIDSPPTNTDKAPTEDESKQSVRNLLQILVPPRAFGLRHADRSVSPISPVVRELGPSRGHHA